MVKYLSHRGVAQLVARDFWEVEAAGSNPVTPTIAKSPPNGLVSCLAGIFYLFVICGDRISLGFCDFSRTHASDF